MIVITNKIINQIKCCTNVTSNMVALLNTRCESISKSDSDKVKDHITNKIIYYIIMNMMLSEKNQNQIRDIARAV